MCNVCTSFVSVKGTSFELNISCITSLMNRFAKEGYVVIRDPIVDDLC